MMSGFELILLILAILGLLSGSYFAAWWYCNGVKMDKTDHYILEDDLNGNETMRKESNLKLYTGLDTVDEARILKLSSLQESDAPLPPSAPGDLNLEQPHYFSAFSVTKTSSKAMSSLSEPRNLP